MNWELCSSMDTGTRDAGLAVASARTLSILPGLNNCPVIG